MKLCKFIVQLIFAIPISLLPAVSNYVYTNILVAIDIFIWSTFSFVWYVVNRCARLPASFRELVILLRL